MHQPILGDIAVFSTLIPVFAGLVCWRFVRSDVAVVFGAFFFSSALSFMEMLLGARSINNLWLINVSVLVETTVLLYVFSRWAGDGISGRVLRAASASYPLVWIALKLTIESLSKPSIIATPLSSVLFSLSAVVVLYRLAQDLQTSLLNDWRFWIIGGTFISASSNVMFFALQSIIFSQPPEAILRVFTFYWILVIASNLIYAVGFLCTRYRMNSGGHLASAA